MSKHYHLSKNTNTYLEKWIARQCLSWTFKCKDEEWKHRTIYISIHWQQCIPSTLRGPVWSYGFDCDLCSEPKKWLILTTGSKREFKDQIHLGTQHLFNFNKANIFVNLDLTTFFKPAESKMGLLCISVGPCYTIWHHSYMVPSVDLLFVLCCTHSRLWERI